jgi:hypoxanthine phosphoribosyltransferase
VTTAAESPTGGTPLPHETVDFAHPSERDFAGVLDFYGVPWRYEPRTFVLAEDDGGNCTEAFTPDFYLPDLDLYIEVTTLRQRLVTKKNGKVRRLRLRYPGVNIMILYRRDWVNLAVKYGLGSAA